MHPSFLVLLSLTVISHSLDQAFNSTFTVPSCQFFLDPSAQNFTFLYCSPSSSQNGRQTDWEKCIDNCCGGMSGVNYPLPDYDTLWLCEQSFNLGDDAESIKTIKFTSIAVACIVIFISLLVLICKFLNPCCANKVAQCYGQSQIQSRWAEQSRFVSKSVKDIIWRPYETRFERDRTCSVCLENNCLAELECGHVYHANCIGQWFKKSNFCPLCHSHSINLIRKYCSQCHQQYLIMRKSSISLNHQVLDQLRCEDCKRNQQERLGTKDGSSKRPKESLGHKEEASHSHFQIILE